MSHWRLVLLVSLCLFAAFPADAQLASSFYNITKLETRVVSNAVQIVIRTDGIPAFGGDYSEILNPQGASPGTTTSFRLRFLNARARLPTLIDIGAYPVDAARVTLGQGKLRQPFFGLASPHPTEPTVDIELNFYVPVTVRRFLVDNSGSGYQGGSQLNAREVAVELGKDGRSVVITAVPDRANAGAAARLKRSPEATLRRHLSVEMLTAQHFRIEALHQPLEEVLNVVARAMHLSFTVSPEAARTDVSLSLPSATPAEFMLALSRAYGLVFSHQSELSQRPAQAGHSVGGYSVESSEAFQVSKRLPLNHLDPAQARLLFPDFLLSSLRVDQEQKALIVTGSPDLVERVSRDLKQLDLPRPQVRIEASIWEVVSAQDVAFALQAQHISTDSAIAFDSSGEVIVRLEDSQQRAFQSTLLALSRRRGARIRASPSITVASGATGRIFVGQNRFVTVLTEIGGLQNADVLELGVGYSLTVAPTVRDNGEISLMLHPRVSTVDALQPGSGLPTLGVREATTTLRVQSGDTILVAGLDANLRFDARDRVIRLPGTRNKDYEQTTLIVLITARLV